MTYRGVTIHRAGRMFYWIDTSTPPQQQRWFATIERCKADIDRRKRG
jgi:hypothetical protein